MHQQCLHLVAQRPLPLAAKGDELRRVGGHLLSQPVVQGSQGPVNGRHQGGRLRVIPRERLLQLQALAREFHYPKGARDPAQGVNQPGSARFIPRLQVVAEQGHVLAMLAGEVAQQGDVFVLIALQCRQPLLQVQPVEALQVGEGACLHVVGQRLMLGLHHPVARQPALQRLKQLGRGDGFGDEIVHAGRFTCLSVFLKGTRRQGEDRKQLPAGQGADGARGIVTIHHRHLYVHQDEIEGVLADALQRLLAIDGGLDDEAAVAKQLQHHFAVDGVVFHQQYPGVVREVGLRHALHERARLRHFPLTCRERGGKPETAPLAKGAADASLPPHQGGEPAGDGEPETGAAVFAGGGDIGLLERLEQLLALLRTDTDTGVLHLEAQQVTAGEWTRHPHPQGDRPLFGELDGIGCIVEQCLA
ncbi:hypothetical protein D3C79_582680 [compost metagenome]